MRARNWHQLCMSLSFAWGVLVLVHLSPSHAFLSSALSFSNLLAVKPVAAGILQSGSFWLSILDSGCTASLARENK